MSEELTKREGVDVNRVTVDEVMERMQKGEPIVFVDSRSEKSWSDSTTQIPGSIRVPPERADEFIAEVPKDRSVITYCT